MKFNIGFTAEIEIIENINDRCSKIKIIEASTDFDTDKCYAYGQFFKAYTGDKFKCNATFKKNDKYGFVMDILDVPELKIPAERKELSKYAASQIPGVSTGTMERVYDVLGGDFIEKINTDNTELDKVEIRKVQKDAIIYWCKNHVGFSKVGGELYMLGLSPEEAIEAYKMYGILTIPNVRENPYCLFYKEICKFSLCDKIATLNYLYDANDSRRIDAIFYLFLLTAEARGNMATCEEDIEEQMSIFQTMLKIKPADMTRDTINESYRRLNGKGLILKPEFNKKCYYIRTENYMAEKRIAKYLFDNNTKEDDSMSERIASLCSDELLDRQKEAVVNCLTNKISVLTGGPGTGKTYTIRNIISVAKQLNPKLKVALMAPTGKAASRMIELIGQEATTIHARLGLSENDDLNQTDGMTINEDIVVIDEASMMDEKLFSYFVNHVSSNSRIVLVGDSGQLPSVGAGNLLEEISKIVKCSQLKVTKRTGSAILNRNAQNIREKNVDKIQYDEDYFEFIEERNNVEDAIVSRYRELYAIEESRPMILAPQYSGPGVDVINKKIQEFNENEAKKYDNRLFKIGDRVICTKNTKELKIHNGDQGEIVDFTEKGIEVLFDGMDNPIEITDIKNIKLSYCITTHKSQGSEANTVIMVFSRAHKNMLSNKLIYTGITRAKKKFIGIGEKQVFIEGCNNDEKPRISLIKDLYDSYVEAAKI